MAKKPQFPKQGIKSWKQLEEWLELQEEPAFFLLATQLMNQDLQRTLIEGDIRLAVETYYDLQQFRMAIAQRAGDVEERTPNRKVKAETPEVKLGAWLKKNFLRLESVLEKVLDGATDEDPVAKQCKEILGIGPVLAAGLSAMIDIHRAPTAGAIWKFAGLTPDSIWLGREKARAVVAEVVGPKPKTKITEAMVEEVAKRIHWRPESFRRQLEKLGKTNRENLTKCAARRPWNHRLKVHCFRIGLSFQYLQNNPNPENYYGRAFKMRKEYEVTRNEAGNNADRAKALLNAKSYGKATKSFKAYTDGRLPDSQIIAQARRWTVKLFLAHWHATAYETILGKPPPNPYPIEFMGHTHFQRKEDFGWPRSKSA